MASTGRSLDALRHELELLESVLLALPAEHAAERDGLERHISDLRAAFAARRGPRPSLEEMLAKTRRKELYGNLEDYLRNREWANYPMLAPLEEIWSTPGCRPGTSDFEYVLAACFGQGLALRARMELQGVQVQVHHTFSSSMSEQYPFNMHVTKHDRSHGEYLSFVLGEKSLRRDLPGPIDQILGWLRIPRMEEYQAEAFAAMSPQSGRTDAAICEVVFHVQTVP